MSTFGSCVQTYKIASATGTANCDVTGSNIYQPANWEGVIATFKGAGASSHNVSATGHVNLSGSATKNRIASASALTNFLLHSYGSSGSLPGGSRFVRGMTVQIEPILPSLPDSCPTVTIANQTTSTTIGTFLVPFRGNGIFRLPYHLGPLLFLGTFTLTFQWTVNGTPYSQVQTFTLVDGGDSGGRVISLYSYTRPDATYLLAQLDSGRLVQGRNPRV